MIIVKFKDVGFKWSNIMLNCIGASNRRGLAPLVYGMSGYGTTLLELLSRIKNRWDKK